VDGVKSKYKLALLLLVLLAAFASLAAYKAYNTLYNVIPESKDINSLKVEELPLADTTNLEISGFPMYSGMVIRNISAKTDGPIITVSLHMALIGLAKPKTVGTFHYRLTVPKSVNEVRFGRDAKLIWKRGSKPQR
jgi:hypothetical protein